MREQVTVDLVVEQLTKLLQAFPRRAGSQDLTVLAGVYYKALQEIDADALRAAVDRSIQEDNFFPKVARLREIAGEWMKRNRSTVYFPRGEELWNQCPICGAVAVSKPVVRQARSTLAPHELLWEGGLDEQGQRIPKLERLEHQRFDIVHSAAAHNFKKAEL